MKLMRQVRLLALPLLGILSIWVVYVVISAWFLSSTYTTREEFRLDELSRRIQKSLRYENGRWDTTLYAADPLTPHPTGSSGFTTPLYIITIDGFVIERNQPIRGYLDSSDFSRLRTITSPQTFTTVTNENWRVLSLLVKDADQVIGVIFVAYYRPHPSIISDIDARLADNASRILSQTRIENGNMDVSTVDISTLDYDIAFEVVDSFNRIRVNNGRTPSFIDVSYVASALQAPSVQRLKDKQSGEKFMVKTTPYSDRGGKTVGLIVLAETVAPIEEFILEYIKFSIVIGMGVMVFSAFFIYRSAWYRFTLEHPTQEQSLPDVAWPKHISFDKKESIMQVDSQSIPIPYATNQYYLCEAVFSSPKKRWELDELLEKFGVESSKEQWRKVYDAMMLINKKVDPYLPEKLILHQEKTYRLNPDFVPLLS